MPNKKRKKICPITSASARPLSHPTSSTTRNVIREFHALQKRKSQLQLRQSQSKVDRDSEEINQIEIRIRSLGGLKRYQEMSRVGQSNDRGGGTERILIRWLSDMKSQLVKEGTQMQLLEVGALEPDNYRHVRSWISSFPIDLETRKPGVLQCDFFDLDRDDNTGKWDIISLSLVLNFVSTPKRRGASFLQLALGH